MISFLMAFILSAQAELQIEARVPLNLSGFKKVKTSFPSKYKERNDIYFDYFDGQNFILSRKVPSLKIRIKEKNSDQLLQISSKENAPLITHCGEIETIVSTKDSAEQDLSNSDYKDIQKQADAAIKSLKQSDVATPAKEFNRLENLLSDQSHDSWDQVVAGKPRSLSYFVVINHARRKKYTKSASLHARGVSLSLKDSLVFDIEGKVYHSYELEIQPDQSDEWTAEDFAKEVCALMPKGLTTSDIADGLHPEEESSLQFYINHKNALGF